MPGILQEYWCTPKNRGAVEALRRKPDVRGFDSLEFQHLSEYFIYLGLPAALWVWNRRSIEQKRVPWISPRFKGVRYIILTILPSLYADFLKFLGA